MSSQKNMPTKDQLRQHYDEHSGYWLLTCYKWRPELVRVRVSSCDSELYAILTNGQIREINHYADRLWTAVTDEGPVILPLTGHGAEAK